MLPNKNDLFHVHTYRCGHAARIPDEEYIKKAAEMGYNAIWFTDHAPFPKDPFYDRMSYLGLFEYTESLRNLKEKYKDTIDVHIGLEIEYFKQYHNYYPELAENPDIDILLLGQHMGEIGTNKYTFDMDRQFEMPYIIDDLIAGIESGFFKVVAHPERAFRKVPDFDKCCEKKKQELLDAVNKNGAILERNSQSFLKYQPAFIFFWDDINVPTIKGADAHWLKDIRDFTKIKDRL